MSTDWLLGLGLPEELVVLIIAVLPVFELRGALPIAINVFHFPWYYALLLAVIGNMLPVPFLLLFFDTFAKLLSKIGIFERMLNWLFNRIRQRGKILNKHKRIGLALFVAIPLPVTGAWTGSFIAVLFGLKFRHAFLSIFIGILIAGIIVTCATLLGWTILGLWKV